MDINIETEFHKKIAPFLTKRQQGYVMGAFRKAIKPLQEELERVDNLCIELGEQLNES